VILVNSNPATIVTDPEQAAEYDHWGTQAV
jgi:carbamoylphosphate synthase large subunit